MQEIGLVGIILISWVGVLICAIPFLLYLWWADSFYRRLWRHCVDRYQDFKVFYNEKEVDNSKFNFANLKEDDWKIKVDFGRQEIYLKPRKGNKVKLPLVS